MEKGRRGNLNGKMLEKLRKTRLIKSLEQSCEKFPDLRTGRNTVYEMPDVSMSAFSVFFTQSPLFLAHQRGMKLRKGRSNAESLFELSELPSDNQIRDLLDPVSTGLTFMFKGLELDSG